MEKVVKIMISNSNKGIDKESDLRVTELLSLIKMRRKDRRTVSLTGYLPRVIYETYLLTFSDFLSEMKPILVNF